MNWFKRLCLFVFGLSGLLSLAALSLVWIGPWVREARTLLQEYAWYYTTLEVLVCITGLGLLVCVLRALFTPRNPRETIVAEVDGGKITVTRSAIISQTKAIVEADGTCVASAIHVRVRKRGHVRVDVRVTPHRPVDVVACGEELYAKLGAGLEQVCGSSVDSISLVFTDPEIPNRAGVVSSDSSFDAYDSGRSDAQSVSLPPERLGVSDEAEVPQDVVVSMSANPSDGAMASNEGWSESPAVDVSVTEGSEGSDESPTTNAASSDVEEA